MDFVSCFPSTSSGHDAIWVIVDRLTKTIRLLKILWSNHGFEEATWEREDEIRSKYPDLFM